MIQLSTKQAGVAKGMAIGMCIAVAIIAFGCWYNPFGFSDSMSGSDRLIVAIKSSLLPALFLGISIARLAKHRFFTPQDIDGGGSSEDSHHAQVLQSILQNTLEQLCLGVLLYFAWVVIMPANTLSVVPLAAIAFAVGRVMFFIGYDKSAPARAIGFTLSFYPSMLMLASMFIFLCWQFIV